MSLFWSVKLTPCQRLYACVLGQSRAQTTHAAATSSQPSCGGEPAMRNTSRAAVTARPCA